MNHDMTRTWMLLGVSWSQNQKNESYEGTNNIYIVFM